MDKLFSRSLNWVVDALRIVESTAPQHLAATVTPTLDVAQNGIAFGTQILVTGSLVFGTASLLMLPADPAYQYLLMALTAENTDPSADLLVRPLMQSQLGAQSFYYPGRNVVVGSAESVLGEFAALPRWVPPGWSFSMTAPVGFTSNTYVRCMALRVPAGFDIAPRGN